MSYAPHQIVIGTLEVLMLLVGGWLLARSLAIPELRAAVFRQNRIPSWHLGGAEVLGLGLTVFVCGLLGQSALMQFLGPKIAESADRAGLQVVLYGVGFHGIALLGWPLFFYGRSRAYANYGASPPTAEPRRRLGWRSVLWTSLLTLLFVLPVLTGVSAAWTLLLRAIGLPDAPQDLIAVFGAVQSPLVLVAMMFVAVVIAPMNEELLFRGIIFRFFRQRFGRLAAFAVSGILFGLLHGNWAGFLPLATLGVALALAYEHSGDIRVPIIAHGLFNLNTTVVLLSGLPGT